MSKVNDYIDEYKKARRGIAIPGKTKQEVIDNFYKQARSDIYWGMKQRYIDDNLGR
ncbi:hypothetical protein LFDSGCCC_CDS0006 [Phage C75C1]|jgi:hypothetical protein|nr:hypothetical protein LFDSGCCC_CDS0006 [Phage C75C1]